MPKKILVVAIGDIYWCRFARLFSQACAEKGLECVIATDSRVGVFQSSISKTFDRHASVYYLSDFAQNTAHNTADWSNADLSIVFCDYLRMLLLGQSNEVHKRNWSKNAFILEKFAQHVLDNEPVGLIISDTVSTSFGYAFNVRAKKEQIPYWGLSGSRLPGRFVVSGAASDEASIVQGLYGDILSGVNPMGDEEIAWAQEYLQSLDTQVPDYMKSPKLNSINLKKYLGLMYFKMLWGTVVYSVAQYNDSRYILFRASPINGVVTALRRNIGRVWRARTAKRLYAMPHELPADGAFFIFPIHYQPEASTVVGSPYHVDQAQVIRNIAFNLPENTYLVVKEHLSNYGYPSKEFYRAIKSLPRVVLVSHDANMKDLIRRSRGVVTMTSTAGYEALLLGKMVFHFGDVFYSYHKNARRISDWKSLKHSLEMSDGVSDVDNIPFVVAYRRYTREGRLDFTSPDFGILPSLLQQAIISLSSR